MNSILSEYSTTFSGLEVLSRQIRDAGESGILTARMTAFAASTSGTVTVLPGWYKRKIIELF